MYHFVSLFLIIVKLKGVDCSFRQLVYRTCQRAEFALLSTEGEPTIESQNVFWHNILPYPPSFLLYKQACFSVSADSQVLLATAKSPANVTSWDINDIGFQANTAQKPVSSFFHLEEWLPASKNPHYRVLGHLVTCQSIFVGDLSVDDREAHWEVIDSNGLFMAQPGDQSASAFISISDIQTSRCHHYLFKDLKHNLLLLYATGIIIINTEAMVIMRIDVNAAADQREWKNVMDGDASHAESLPICGVGQGSPLLVVSQDGLTLAYLSRLVDGPGNLWMLQRWDTTTGFLTHSSTLNIRQQKPMSLVLSASGTISIIVTSHSESRETSLRIVSFDNGGAVHEVIDCGHPYWSKETFPVVASFPDERKIAYLTEDAHTMVIQDIRAKNDIFRHHFPPYEVPSDIMITPDGKTLITVHPLPHVIRIWNVEGL
ncbi:hypothetical protein ARMSODRAFT_1040216 [Armillaria solidipes]|uniref:WD40 repeat-like protein n=1 Tax=Armillaria solidipes TaxID=1076256 RepID=A0A2H3BNL6_9AGAR|nr:hypothetical protein ARMSODRAFT_1040216 [Armillaria solidipes]